MDIPGAGRGIPADISDAAGDDSDQASTTTISTVAVQAGKAKIVLAILRVSPLLILSCLLSNFVQ